MDRHISRTSKSAFFHLHNIRRISKYLDQESLLTLTHAFITSRLDYCNSLLYGAPVTQIEKLQRIQNAAARPPIFFPRTISGHHLHYWVGVPSVHNTDLRGDKQKTKKKSPPEI